MKFPMFNQDNGMKVSSFAYLITKLRADGVIIATPEHNHTNQHLNQY